MTWHVSYRGPRAEALSSFQAETRVPPKVRTILQMILDSPAPPGRRNDEVYVVCSGTAHVCRKDLTWSIDEFRLHATSEVPRG